MANAEVQLLVQSCFTDGLSNAQIVRSLRIENNISISERTVRRYLRRLNLRRRQIHSNLLDLRTAVEHEVQSSGGNLGYRAMMTRLRISYGLTAPRDTVCQLLRELDPEGVSMRSTHTLRRRVYTNQGPNYLIHIDGYDKLKRYGICIHGAIDGYYCPGIIDRHSFLLDQTISTNLRYSKKILWFEAGHTNNDPKFMAWNFMQYIHGIKGVPRCVRMDRGTENTLIEDIQASFRARHTDEMAQHSVLYGSSTHNQPIERWWRSARQLGLNYFIDYFKNLEMEGAFEVGNVTDVLCVRYCFLHIIQQKLQEIRMEWNAHNRRLSRAESGGVPNTLYNHPQLHGHVDYKTAVPIQDILDVMELTSPPLNRGCSEQERQNMDTLVSTFNGPSVIPYTLEEARTVYLSMRTALR